MNCYVMISLGFLWIVRIILGFDHRFDVDMSQNQNQGDVQLNKKESDEKKKAESSMTWHRIVWWFPKKEEFEGASVQSVEAEEEREDMLFWPSTKSRYPRDWQGQPNWLVWWGRWLSVMSKCFGSFFMFFYMSRTFWFTLWYFE